MWLCSYAKTQHIDNNRLAHSGAAAERKKPSGLPVALRSDFSCGEPGCA